MSAGSPALRWSRKRYGHAVRAGVFEDVRAELLDGEIVAVPRQSPAHAGAARWLRNALTLAVDDSVWMVGGHEPIALDDWSEPEPDVWLARAAAVAPGDHPGVEAVTLLVEVSCGSGYVDRVRKLPLYAGAGVPEYWIVHLQSEVVHVHRDPAGDGYRQVSTAARGDRIPVPGTNLAVDVDELLGP